MRMSVKEKIDEYERKIPILTSKVDLLNQEADILDGRAERSFDSLKSIHYKQQAINKRLQAEKLLDKVEKMLSDLTWMKK